MLIAVNAFYERNSLHKVQGCWIRSDHACDSKVKLALQLDILSPRGKSQLSLLGFLPFPVKLSQLLLEPLNGLAEGALADDPELQDGRLSGIHLAAPACSAYTQHFASTFNQLNQPPVCRPWRCA